MSHQPRAEYLKTQVMTASPETLQLMLWDGAIRFAEQGKAAIIAKEIEASYNALLRSQKIILEILTSLRPEVNPELCKKLAPLYNYIYRCLIQANTKKDIQAVDDALKLMRHQRETWVMLMEKLTEERTAESLATANENAQAINQAVDTAQEIAATVQSALTPTASAPKRSLYSNLAQKSPRPESASLSIQG